METSTAMPPADGLPKNVAGASAGTEKRKGGGKLQRPAKLQPDQFAFQERAMTTPAAILPATDTEIVSTRVFAASREELFDAFRDPLRLAQWWGPGGFTNCIQTFDFRPGGEWRLIMHAPDGTDHPTEFRFVEMARPERIVFEHLRPMRWHHMTMLFTESPGGTRLTWRMRFETAAEVMKIGRVVTRANQETFDRLEDALRIPACLSTPGSSGPASQRHQTNNTPALSSRL